MEFENQNLQDIPFSDVVKALLDYSVPFSGIYLHKFSDITPENLKEIRSIWQQVKSDRKIALLEDLAMTIETDTLMSFDDFCMFTLDDDHPHVRTLSIRLLFESENFRIASKFMKLLKKDPDEEVRANAAQGLGFFLYLGEVDRISNDLFADVESHLFIQFKQEKSSLVLQKILESIGFSSRSETSKYIATAYQKPDIKWKTGAVIAMGRSADKRWEKYILENLDHDDDQMQIEAVKASGELEISKARQTLMELTISPRIENRELRSAVIWSLSQIGGGNTAEVINALLETAEDEEEEDFINEALENLNLTNGFSNEFGMFDIELDDDDDNDDDELYGFDEEEDLYD